MLLCPTIRAGTVSSSVRAFASPLAILLLFIVAIPTQPAKAERNSFDYNFRVCGAELARAGIPPAVAANSCSAVLYPKDLTTCVLTIYKQTSISSGDALTTCRQVRRPRDLGNCVVNISVNTLGGSPRAILDGCRRSLLPVRFGECVVGLSQSLNLSVGLLMANCIDGSDRPRDFYPPGRNPLQQAPPQQPLPLTVPPPSPPGSLQVPPLPPPPPADTFKLPPLSPPP